MFGAKRHKLSIDHELYERLEAASRVAGYASADEFIVHILEKTVPREATDDSEEQVRQRLKGLGYLE